MALLFSTVWFIKYMYLTGLSFCFNFCVLGKGGDKVILHFPEPCKTGLYTKQHHCFLLQGGKWEWILCSEHLCWICAFLVQKASRSTSGVWFCGTLLFVLFPSNQSKSCFSWLTTRCYNLNTMSTVLLMEKQDVGIQSGQAWLVGSAEGMVFPYRVQERDRGLRFVANGWWYREPCDSHVQSLQCLRWAVCCFRAFMFKKLSGARKDKEAHED